ncbi:transcriptional corepressor LEUNIG-like [Nicotiana tabacum]|uniref:Transcriptional corepressor LEUNIG-like n=1 Tax=Nicotiana tabacum TaxID=4097 RepID=A0AC58T1C8_TOBAC
MIWDAAKPSNPFQKLVGHADHVMSIDFHPSKVGLLSSCDSNDEIRLWDVNDGDCKLIFKGGSRQVRFQPRFGNLLACSTGNIINIFDVETNSIQQQLQGHVGDVRSICWDMSGNFLASVSEDSARIWCVSGRKCLHELRSSGNKFQSCTFHPDRAQILDCAQI